MTASANTAHSLHPLQPLDTTTPTESSHIMANASSTLNENAKAWVAALRSGEYTQTKKMLHRVTQENENSFCCLGVACDLYRNSVGGDWDMIRQDACIEQARFTDNKGASADSDLTPAVMDWLGLADSEGAYCVGTLVSLNDNLDFTFDQIADAIESQPEGLFRTE